MNQLDAVIEFAISAARDAVGDAVYDAGDAVYAAGDAVYVVYGAARDTVRDALDGEWEEE